MTLQTHVDVILKWIVSCNDDSQLDLLLDVVNEFVANRFKHEGMLCDMAVEELLKAMSEQKLIIKRMHFQSLPKFETT